MLRKSHKYGKKIITLLILTTIIFRNDIKAQKLDSSKIFKLKEVVLNENQISGSKQPMPDIKNNVIYTGKKSEQIILNKLNADLSTNNTRQIFSKIPGISIWENDGSGIQTSIASRGLSPNRSWEFNVKQNGYDISSDAFGYPECYYTPPSESLEKIELIRGAASLQFGPQFGGMVNYEIKKGNPFKPISFESQQTFGTFNLFNTYNALGGTVKKLSYYGFVHNRTADGWRDNNKYNIFTGYLSANYQFTNKFNVSAEYTHMDYVSQQAGGLTDAQFAQNAKQSFRERNWFNAPFNIASITLKYDISESFKIQLKSFYSFAERNSVGFMSAISNRDTINANTLQYNNRQVDRDDYKNFGTELRTIYQYTINGKTQTLATGFRLYEGLTNRNQQGVGTTSHKFDLTLVNPVYGKSLDFKTSNYALFAENVFSVGNKFKIIPGVRLEFIDNQISGYINTSNTGKLNTDNRIRKFVLYGLGSEYAISKTTKLYSNYSQSFRPVTFSELTPSATNEIVDPNLKDAKGYNFDFGYRGDWKNILNFDIGVFYLNYDNRIGVVPQNQTTLKTNIGTSVSKGIESFIELNPLKLFNAATEEVNFSLFASNSFIDAKYTRWDNQITNDPLKIVKNKRVENAPRNIHRFGMTYFKNLFSITLQYSYVDDVFTDALNTEIPNATATIGKISSYKLFDVSMGFKFLEHYNVKAGINNLTDEKYATRRAGGYPGPGLLPGTGRNAFISFGVNL